MPALTPTPRPNGAGKTTMHAMLRTWQARQPCCRPRGWVTEAVRHPAVPAGYRAAGCYPLACGCHAGRAVLVPLAPGWPEESGEDAAGEDGHSRQGWMRARGEPADREAGEAHHGGGGTSPEQRR